MRTETYELRTKCCELRTEDIIHGHIFEEEKNRFLWAAKMPFFLRARKIREGIAKSLSRIGDFLWIKSTVAIR